MNRTQSKARTYALASKGFTSNIHRTIATLLLTAFIPAAAVAQYSGGGPAPSYGSKGAAIGGVAAGAAVGAGLLYWKFHKQATLQGCVAGDGDKLVTENDNRTYNLTHTQNQSLKIGERVELLGKKMKSAAGEPTFEVHKMSRDLGQCTTTSAAAVNRPN